LVIKQPKLVAAADFIVKVQNFIQLNLAMTLLVGRRGRQRLQLAAAAFERHSALQCMSQITKQRATHGSVTCIIIARSKALEG
jgi:hypothetical protein